MESSAQGTVPYVIRNDPLPLCDPFYPPQDSVVVETVRERGIFLRFQTTRTCLLNVAYPFAAVVVTAELYHLRLTPNSTFSF